MHTGADLDLGDFPSKYPTDPSPSSDPPQLPAQMVSRSTEGSGLGLSIAKNLVGLQGGTFDIYLDGDLFKVVITFEAVDKES